MIQLRLSSHSEVIEFRTRSADACDPVLFLSVLVKFRFMSEEEFMKPVVIVGAGLSGLTCAKILHESGISVTVFDKLRVAVLRQKILDLSNEQIFKRPDQSTVCGDHVVSASIEGAISSGKIAPRKSLLDDPGELGKQH